MLRFNSEPSPTPTYLRGSAENDKRGIGDHENSGVSLLSGGLWHLAQRFLSHRIISSPRVSYTQLQHSTPIRRRTEFQVHCSRRLQQRRKARLGLLGLGDARQWRRHVPIAY